MKKFFVMIMIVAIVIMGNSYEVFLYAKKVIFGDPTTHTIQQGEYLSKIAQHYYGNADYWRELALVNRAPKANLVFPGEEIIIPRKEVIINIRKARSLSDVNLFVRGEEDILARLDKSDVEHIPVADVIHNGNPKGGGSHPVPVADKSIADNNGAQSLDNQVAEPQEAIQIDRPASIAEDSHSSRLNNPTTHASSLNLIYAAIAIVLMCGIIAIWLYNRRKRIRFEEEFAVMDDVEIDDDSEDHVDDKDNERLFPPKRNAGKKDTDTSQEAITPEPTDFVMDEDDKDDEIEFKPTRNMGKKKEKAEKEEVHIS